MRQLLQALLTQVRPYLSESLPPQLLAQSGLMGCAEALQQIHFPQNAQALEMARRRLKFEELLLIQLKLIGQKIQRKEKF